MRVAGVVCLCAIALVCLASASLAGSYQGVCGIPYTGANSDRGIAVNKNVGSPYYGYFYGIDSASGAIRIWKPDANGTSATSYSNTGKKLSWPTPAPAGTLLMHVFVGPDDTVWVADYGAKKIAVGPPDGSVDGANLTEVAGITMSRKPRSLYVLGSYGAAGTKIYVAECEGTTATSSCEVFSYDGTTWTGTTLGTLGLAKPYFVTVDSAGNSYWASNGTTAPFVKKVNADLTEDTAWTFTKPSFFGTGWAPGGISYVHDTSDPANQDYLYISAYNQTSCSRYDMNGVYIDGYGNTAGMIGTPPAGTWTSIALSAPSSGNKVVWHTSDDARNTYVSVIYPGTTEQAYKIHLQEPPQPPTGLQAANDVYGQIKLTWTPPAGSSNSPTQYRIYRGSAPGNATLYATALDAYPKWKDSAQGTTPGGPFYYIVKSYNGAGESAASNEVGPIYVASSTAPAPRSLGVALSYSEFCKADTVNNPAYDRDWNTVAGFLADRSVNYSIIYDADTTQPNIENDDIAGYSLLILGNNRNMSSYTAQCIADYCKYSQGRVFSNYYNSIANVEGVRQPDFYLKDVYRLNASTAGTGGSPWVADPKYRYLRQIGTAPEAAALFAGLTGAAGEWDGAQMWNFNSYLSRAYTDGTASEVGKWYDIAGAQSIADPDDVGLIVGYADSSRTIAQSVYAGTFWWAQASGSFSAARLLENILGFFGVSFTPYTSTMTVADAKARSDAGGVLLNGKVVTRQMTQMVYQPGPQNVLTSEVFYVQDATAPSGIKVQMPQGMTVAEGDVVNIAGQITTDRVQTSAAGISPVTYGKFERVIVPIEMTQATGGTLPEPIYIGNKSVGGGTQGAQLGVTGGIGLNNVGLLVTVVGTLTYTGTDLAGNGYFLIDDGAGYQIPGEFSKGIKVIGYLPGDAIPGDMIQVTGIIGAEYIQTGDVPPITAVIPVIRTRNTDVAVKIL